MRAGRSPGRGAGAGLPRSESRPGAGHGMVWSRFGPWGTHRAVWPWPRQGPERSGGKRVLARAMAWSGHGATLGHTRP